jgi:hypothetical protein
MFLDDLSAAMLPAVGPVHPKEPVNPEDTVNPDDFAAGIAVMRTAIEEAVQ